MYYTYIVMYAFRSKTELVLVFQSTGTLVRFGITAESGRNVPPWALELWQVHTEHINRVFKNGGKGRGCQNNTYHPKLMNWTIAFLARTSSGMYNEVAKIFMLPHISTVHQKMAEIITTKNKKA